jgi:DnaA-homolog protein
MKQLALGVRLRTAAVFENYYVGPNSEAVAAVKSSAGNPVWISGAAATGKTHLLQAACAASGAASAYFPLRQQTTAPPEAIDGFERLGLICIDDLESVAGQIEWEKALFKLFNAAAETHARLLFAARSAPTALRWVLADWASRAGSCTVYQLRLLDDDERIEALRMRANLRGLELPLETAEYLLRRMPRDQQVLFDMVDALDDAALVAQRRLTVPFVRAALKLG